MDAHDVDNTEKSNSKDEDDMMFQAATAASVAAAYAVVKYSQAYFNKLPYHNFALTGFTWILELLTGHPKCIHTELGVHKHVFRSLIITLQNAGYMSSRFVMLEKQLAIFLYICVTGLSLIHVSKHFQQATGTTSKYFLKMLEFFSSPSFYNDCVRLPSVDTPVPSKIQNNPKFYPFFKDTLGAIDGTHINCCPSAVD